MDDLEKIKAQLKAELKAEVLEELKNDNKDLHERAKKGLTDHIVKELTALGFNAADRYKLQTAIYVFIRFRLKLKMINNLLPEQVDEAKNVADGIIAVLRGAE